MNLDMTEFYQTFFEESADLLVDMESFLLQIEERPGDLELLNSIFRCAHSIKGGASTFGFSELAHFTHGLETMLDRLRNGQLQINVAISQILLEAVDQLKALLSVARGEALEAPDSTALVFQMEEMIAQSGVVEEDWNEAALREQIEALVRDRDQESGELPVTLHPELDSPKAYNRYRLTFKPGPEVCQTGSDPLLLLEQFLSEVDVIRTTLDIEQLPSLDTMDPEVCYVAWTVDFATEKDTKALSQVFEFVADTSDISVIALDGSVISGLVTNAEASTGCEDCAPVSECISVESVGRSSSDETGNSRAPVPLLSQDSTEIANHPGLPAGPTAPQSPKGEGQMLRVSTDKVDKLINLVGELVINQSMLNDVIESFSMDSFPRLLEAVAQMERASRDLQERVMAIRMLPIKHAFGRFPRLVRDLASASGKKIDLVMSGEDTELDKTVIEVIADPLTHLVRNSADHGLELPGDRLAAGKPEHGTISLHASQEGGSIVVEVGDDGQGLNRERILSKAIQKGLTTEVEAAVMSDEAVNAFIFHAGFSTAPTVTDLSGRGVGMDIVRNTVVSLGGSISVLSKQGHGSKFRIKLPLTMAILEGLSVSVGREVYIMSLTGIVESIQPRRSEIQMVMGQEEIVQVRGEVLPIVRLYRLFDIEPVKTDPTEALLVIVEHDGQKLALLVDELIGQSQIVIKSLETNYRKVDGIAGATIMGDGRVALILDIPGVFSMRKTGEATRRAA